jgi:hypothetical protein
MKLYRKYGSLLKHYMLSLYEVKGEFEGNPFRLLVADDGTTLDYISRLAFPNEAEVARVGRISAVKCTELADADADLVVVGASSLLTRRYLHRGFRIIPKWLKMIMPVKEDPYAWFSSFGKHSRSYFNRKIHKIEGAGYECEVVYDKNTFSRFYHEMYKPYTIQRFNEDAVVYSMSILEKFFNQGCLIISKKNGEPAAGVIMHQEGGVIHLPFGGITGGNAELVKEGAMFAIHYFLTNQAYSWGYSHIDFGRSRPFLSDGTLQYKLAWHSDAIPCDDVMNVFAVATPGRTPQGLRFLQAQPHFYLDGNDCRRSDE